MKRNVFRLRALPLVLLFLFCQPLLAQEKPPAPATNVVAVGLTVSDLDRSIEFYRDVLDFETVSVREISVPDGRGDNDDSRARQATMRLGDEIIELTQYANDRAREFPPDSRSHDRWFQHIAIIVRDMDQAYRQLRNHKVRHASSAPQTLPDWNPAAGGIRAFYFRDRDGHYLEILQFPPGKGNAKWHRSTDRLFLGIDHTAIVVADTDRSVQFYEKVAGLRVAGSGENYGTEQEHLNGVFGAHLKITTLRGASGPGVELLEYLFPSDGRDYPADSRAEDLWHWEVCLSREGDTVAADRPGTDQSGSSETHAGKPVAADSLLRDPDGHALRFLHNDR